MYAKEGKIFYSTILFSVTWTASLRRASMSSSLESPAASIVAFRSSLSHLKVQTEAQHHSEKLRFFWVIFDLLHMILVPWKGSKVFTQLLQASAYHIFELDISTKIVFWNTRRLFLEAAAKEGRYKARALHYTRTLFIGQLPSQQASWAGLLWRKVMRQRACGGM